ncbi:MAG: hypothetical protein FWF31_05020 [Desulfobulbus sp.]|nr:hypothetical protein [Desulfobulbus sp.]
MSAQLPLTIWMQIYLIVAHGEGGDANPLPDKIMLGMAGAVVSGLGVLLCIISFQ